MYQLFSVKLFTGSTYWIAQTGISSFQLIRVRVKKEKEKTEHGSRKVFIFSKTYKENFVFLRGGETRGKNETSGKDSTVTTWRCFFGGREGDLFGIEMKMTTKCHKGICQMSLGKGIARERAQKWPAERVTNRTLVEKAAICRCFRLYCSRLSNRQPYCVVTRR